MKEKMEEHKSSFKLSVGMSIVLIFVLLLRNIFQLPFDNWEYVCIGGAMTMIIYHWITVSYDLYLDKNVIS